MMPTIKDVAEKAGVGIATVSRAMNGTGYVSARSREKIETAIRELHYIPNERARNLSRKQTGIIGVLIPDFQTPFYASFLRQVEMELYNYGYRTMVCNTVKHSDREAAYVEMLDRNMLDGLITCAWSAEAEVYRHMDKPIVSMDHNLGEGIPLIHSDHKTGGRIAAEHLLEKGCKRVLETIFQYIRHRMTGTGNFIGLWMKQAWRYVSLIWSGIAWIMNIMKNIYQNI